jgi:glutaredoxin
MLLALLACSSPALAEIYRWTDANGKVHYVEKKPAEGAGGQTEPLQGKGGVSFVGGGGTGAASSVKVRMFMTQSCPYCRKAKAFLQKRGIPYEELDIEASAGAKAEYDRLGGNGVPVILVGERRMDGFDARRMERMLAEAGL